MTSERMECSTEPKAKQRSNKEDPKGDAIIMIGGRIPGQEVVIGLHCQGQEQQNSNKVRVDVSGLVMKIAEAGDTGVVGVGDPAVV
jgi:hypothetical protein